MDPNQLSRTFPIPKPTHFFPLSGGGNNRLFKLEFKDRNPLVLKQYFQHPNDLRPRLHAEFSFLKYAWNIGIRNIPEPLYASANSNEALYSFLPCNPIQVGDITDSLVQQILSFFHSLNQQKQQATDLPKASEACFCANDYLEITEKRVLRLLTIPDETPIEKEVKFFVIQNLIPKWEKLKEFTCKAALHSSLEPENQCVTPSDFGFHNALLHPSGELYFIDFEYAGWDDPCKTVCDFFCQPKIPIPMSYFKSISESISTAARNPEACLKRIELFSPVIQMKWCCIILNVFTQVGKNRRAFSHSTEIERLEKQLYLAKERLQNIAI